MDKIQISPILKAEEQKLLTCRELQKKYPNHDYSLEIEQREQKIQLLKRIGK